MKLSKKFSKLQNSRGSILVVCLVLAGLGTIGVAAWVSLLDARGHVAEQGIVATERLVRYRNSKIVAKDMAFRRRLIGADNARSVTLANDMGFAQLGASTNPLVETAATRTQKIGSQPFRAFSEELAVSVSDGDTAFNWNYQLKSANPMAYGDLLTIHNSIDAVFSSGEAPTVTGEVHVHGRAVLWPTSVQNNLSAIKAEEFYFPELSVSGMTLSHPAGGTPLAPQNFPVSPTSTGTVNTSLAGSATPIPADLHLQGYATLVSSVPSSLGGGVEQQNSYAHRLANIGDYASINATVYAYQGAVPKALGSGPDTIAASPADGSLITDINDTNISDTVLEQTLIDASPLSSDVMTALLNRTPALSLVNLLNVTNANLPLADDVNSLLNSEAYENTFPDGTQEIYNAGLGTYLISNGAGDFTLDLRDPLLPNLLLTNFTSLTIKGHPTSSSAEDDENLEPRLIVLNNDLNVKLQQINFQGFNDRRIVLAIANKNVLDNAGIIDEAGIPVTSPNARTVFQFSELDGTTISSPSWRMICELQGTIADWNLSNVQGVLTIKGGIRTDNSIHVSNTNTTRYLKLTQEDNLEDLAPFLIRHSWLEAFRVPLGN